jgi:poly-gamma-glutamate capsule biosynthesis protein CapA/YwtB (metallophosphatase superfamily)
MKKVLLSFVVIAGLFGYLSYSWMKSHGWTIFSNENYVKSPETSTEISGAITSLPLLFAGDIMLGRYVETLSERSGDELYPFKEIEDYLKQRVTVINLEGPIPEVHKPTPINGFSFSFPSYVPRILKEAGITAVTLANNHMFDQGRNGYEETKLALDAEGLAHFGGYAPTQNDYFEAMLGDTSVVVYGITMIATGWDESQALDVTRKLRSEHKNSYLIAFMHWGDEYKTQNAYQREFAHALIENGVDAIIGSHPHVIQGIEIYDNKPIFYSLGNFIFDQYQAANLSDGVMIQLSREDKEYVYDIVPIHENRSVPSVATSTKRMQILENISAQSALELQASVLEGKIRVAK